MGLLTRLNGNFGGSAASCILVPGLEVVGLFLVEHVDDFEGAYILLF